jgi:hypothetical protein
MLTSFVAIPASGATPLKTTLTWSVADAEGDSLRCDVDLDADGTLEHQGLDCALGRLTLEVRAPGVHPVTLTARDELDGTNEATLSLAVLEPRGDLRLSRLDFGQSVVKETLALVEGKPALLRASVLADEADLTARVVVEASKRGTVLGSRPLVGPAVVPMTEDLGDLSKQFRVELPPEWVTPGVQLTVKVDPEDAVPETDETNNTQVLSPTVTRGHVLHLTAVPVVQAGLTGAVRDVEKTVTDVWPVKGVETKTRAPYTFSGVLSGGGGSVWAALLDELAQVKAADGSQRHYYGFVRVTYGSGIAGIGYLGQGVATGRDDSLGTVAHELGHNFGRPHAPCGGAGDADPNFPYTGARIGTFGWNGAQLLSPNRYVDLMSYCSPEWVSDYSYEKVQQFMSGRAAFAPEAMLPDLRWTDAALVSGRVLPSGEVSWAPVHRIWAAVREPSKFDAELVLLTPSGARLHVPVELHETSEGNERHFVAVVPWPGALAGVALAVKGEIVGHPIAPKESAPFAARAWRVDDRSIRVTWSGLPWLAVAHHGTERTTLALGATGGDLLVRVDGLRGGTLELSGSDGVHSERLEVPLP